MCFFKHPFFESSKLAIVDANYLIPEDSRYSDKMHDLIRHLITPNPKNRPSAEDVLEIADNFFKIDKI